MKILIVTLVLLIDVCYIRGEEVVEDLSLEGKQFFKREKRQDVVASAETGSTTEGTSVYTVSAKILSDICVVQELPSGKQTATKILFYISAGWVVAWCMACIVVNSVYQVYSMERLLEMIQEFGYIVLFVFMGIFVYPQDSKGLCTATAIIIMFFTDFVALIFLVKEVLATFMIRNIIKHINSFHWSIAILFPIVGAVVSTVVGYYTCSDYFGIQQPHCFCYTRTKQFWAFVMPVWISFVLMTLVQQFAFTMCKMTELEGSNLAQMYWSFKTCKSSTLLFTWSAVTIFSLMFAVDLQVMWLSFGYFLSSIIFGPMLFVCHTYSHANTCISLYAQTSIPFYRPCPPPPASYNEQINFMLSIRMQIPLFEDPSIQRNIENIPPNRMVIIETPPSIKKRTKRKRTYLGDQNIRPVAPPPVVDWQ